MSSTQNNMIRALMKGRYTEGQAKLILKELSIAPDKNLTSKKLGAIFKSVDRTIRQELIQARSDTKNKWLDETDRNDAYIKQKELNKFIWNLGVPQEGEAEAAPTPQEIEDDDLVNEWLNK